MEAFIHPGSERFSDISQGRQCSFMNFSALLFAQTLPIEQCTASNVDQTQLMRIYRACNYYPEDYPSTQETTGEDTGNSSTYSQHLTYNL